ncbi:putative nuclease HARBI1 isoform X2 [Odontomachus brunneus]|uniref:putative nuclease HARBI1 isoform X2 n=1 Tax=Odontomachus brunneus TaxID=486640 RepID=UPI0013F273B9|nr:putative nuclease HARBI1 isoform X2 [Odontomachus brunneus]
MASICEKFDVSRSTALIATRRVIKILYNLAPFFIKWPSRNNLQTIWGGFEATSAFPKVIGAIDGTHINIPAPHDEPASYVNRKGHHSIPFKQCMTIKHISLIASQDIQGLCMISEYSDYQKCKSGWGTLRNFPIIFLETLHINCMKILLFPTETMDILLLDRKTSISVIL